MVETGKVGGGGFSHARAAAIKEPARVRESILKSWGAGLLTLTDSMICQPHATLNISLEPSQNGPRFLKTTTLTLATASAARPTGGARSGGSPERARPTVVDWSRKKSGTLASAASRGPRRLLDSVVAGGVAVSAASVGAAASRSHNRTVEAERGSRA